MASPFSGPKCSKEVIPSHQLLTSHCVFTPCTVVPRRHQHIIQYKPLPAHKLYSYTILRTHVRQRCCTLSSTPDVSLCVHPHTVLPERHQHEFSKQPHIPFLTFQNVENVFGCIPVNRLVAGEEVLFRCLHSPLNFIRSDRQRGVHNWFFVLQYWETNEPKPHWHLSQEHSWLITMSQHITLYHQRSCQICINNFANSLTWF